MRRLLFALFLVSVLPALSARSQWQSEDPPLTLTPPDGWSVMSEQLLEHTNQTVRHVTDGPFIAGYLAHESETLLFPYLLVQYSPYTDLPEAHRATHRLDEHGQLQLIARLATSLNAPDPLPAEVTVAQFAETYQTGQVRLVRLAGGGVFELKGSIPPRGGGGQIDYHTVGRLGREGVAYVTVFTNAGGGSIEQVAGNALQSLAFAEGAGFDGLPLRDTGVVGFLPPPAEPMPADALVLDDGAFGFVPVGGFVPMRGGAFEPDDPRLMSAFPAALETAGALRVLTRTPTSQRITKPWVAVTFAPWATAGGSVGPLERRLTVGQWADVLHRVAGVDVAAARIQLRALADNPSAAIDLIGNEPADEGHPPWLVEAVDMPSGRVVFSRRVRESADPTLSLRDTVTLVAGVEGMAVMVSQTYTDAPEDELESLSMMAASLRFAGGGRLVDIPPARDGDATGRDTAVATPGGTTTEGNAAAGGAGPAVGEDAVAAPPTTGRAGDAGAAGAAVEAETDGSAVALPLILGVLGLVFVGVAVSVVVTTHRKAQRQREKARARRERHADGGAGATHKRESASRSRRPRH